jgi:CelD/BcsL family acetyltransferase involved in cellulose biosynthesis
MLFRISRKSGGGTDMLRVESIDTRAQILSLKPIWNDLLARSDMDVPFMTFEWLQVWLKTYGNDFELLVLLVKDEGSVIAIVPLKRGKIKLRGISVNAIAFLANDWSARTGMITDGANKACFAAVLDHLKKNYRYDLLHLDQIVKDSLTDKLIQQEIRNRGLRFRQMQGANSPYIVIAGTWDAYLQKLSKKLRNNLNYKKKTIEKAGTYEIIRYRENDIPRALSDILRISRNTWKFEQKAGIAGAERTVEFVSSLIRMLEENKMLNILVLYLEKIPVAFALNIEYRGKIYMYQISYDQNYRNIAPGYFLIVQSIQEAFEKGYKELDFLGKEERFKMELTSTCRPHCKYFLFNDTFRGRILQNIECFVIPALAGLRRLIRRSEMPLEDPRK